MKKYLILIPLLYVGLSLSGQSLYIQPINGQQIAFSIAENPRITFGNGTKTINETTFQLSGVQNLSFVRRTPTSIIAVGSDNKFFVFPNPVTNELHIVHNWQSGDVVELFDMIGRHVFSQRVAVETQCIASLQSDTFTIDMTSFPNGNYILRVGNQTVQIVKQ